MTYDLIVIGGGAAGFFSAIQLAESRPGTSICILEKSNKVLAKVKISGGGRCNVTHHDFNAGSLSQHYPRGEKFLRKIFPRYQARDVVDWFARQGVALKTEEDGRMFPETDDSQTIIDCFLSKVREHRISLFLGQGVVKMVRDHDGWKVICHDGKTYHSKTALIATGGHPSQASYDWIQALGHTIAKPIPSLFTFNDPQGKFKDLMGLSVPSGWVRIAGTNFSEEGPLLITHWGLSGPAAIKLSAWAAEYLFDKHYETTLLVSWIGNRGEEDTRKELQQYQSTHGRRKVSAWPLYQLPQRLWDRLCFFAEIHPEKTWDELPLRNLNKLLEGLIRTSIQVKGKTTFKEEFVTCGGVLLQEVDANTLQSKKAPDIFFAGEVLHIDGETGGFNFQAAWTTGFVAAEGVSNLLR
jgi:predicted Rossmann fold flavoprotein